MKRTTAILSALLMGTAFAATPALAANTTSPKSVNDTTTPSADASGSMSSDSSMGAKMSMEDMATMLKSIDPSSVKVVTSTNKADKSAGTLPTNTTAEEQASLQAAIESNSALNQELMDNGVEVSNVTAATIEPDGSTVRVYVK